jgi:hypothetical protein
MCNEYGDDSVPLAAPPATEADRLAQNIRNLFLVVGEIVVKKNQDYGTRNIAVTPFGSDTSEVVRAVVTRLGDKLGRMANLVTTGRLQILNADTFDSVWDQAANYEAAHDTAVDIMGYGAILALVLNGEWPGVA